MHLQSMRAVLHCHIVRFLRKSTLPELSNFGESPGRAGGLPFELTLNTTGPSVKGFPLETKNRLRIDFMEEMA